MTNHYTVSLVLFPPYANTLPPHLRWLLVHGSVWWTPLCCGAHHQTWLTQSQSVGHLSSSQHECLVSEHVETQRTREVGKNWVWLANTDMVIINWLIAEAGLCSPFLHHRRCRSLNWWKGCSLVWGLCVSILCDEGLWKEGSVTMSCVLITCVLIYPSSIPPLPSPLHPLHPPSCLPYPLIFVVRLNKQKKTEILTFYSLDELVWNMSNMAKWVRVILVVSL